MHQIDINCDMGELPGTLGAHTIDEQILPYVSSANIACGFHAGDPARMEMTVAAAQKHGVAIGAHPGLDDRANFGRVAQHISPREVYQLIIYQLGALAAFTKVAATSIHHIKPHGALYNMIAQDQQLSEALVAALIDYDPNIILYALAGSTTVQIARKQGIYVAEEGFADRRYTENGFLVSRAEEGAVITDQAESLQQALSFAKPIPPAMENEQDKNSSVKLHIDTICIHSDGQHALLFAKEIYRNLTNAGVVIQSPQNEK